ncbi:RNA exonuclease complex component [Scheffersomyces amazonensis]|uniref:RNA exonuclease complex component n=1 Tax=Scheffersomyces amazonensis TaxID=1078765 RepID=UPI00315CADC0
MLRVRVASRAVPYSCAVRLYSVNPYKKSKNHTPKSSQFPNRSRSPYPQSKLDESKENFESIFSELRDLQGLASNTRVQSNTEISSGNVTEIMEIMKMSKRRESESPAQAEAEAEAEAKIFEEDIESIKKIVAGTRSKTPLQFFNPENKRLNLNLNNKILYRQISQDVEMRMEKRWQEPSQRWLEKFNEITSEIEMDKSVPEDERYSYFKKKISGFITSATISPQVVYETIDVGDVVTLNNDSVKYYLVIKRPDSLNNHAYTFIDRLGEIVHASKASVIVRFPQVIPKQYHKLIESLVQLETKHLHIAPIGMVDERFSRSQDSLPESLRKDYNDDDLNSEGDSWGTANDDDFLVAQATSQLLTDSSVNTYHVPLAARELYAQALTDISIRSFDEMTEVGKKLDILHKKLQYDQNDDLISVPRSISMFELLYYMQNENFIKLDDTSTYESSVSVLGKELKEIVDFDSKSYPIATFLSTILSLRKQARLWSIDIPRAGFTPLNVSILPITNIGIIQKIMNYLKYEQGDKLFAQYYFKLMQGKNPQKPEHYDSVIKLFKDYVVGNFTSDPALETAIVSVIRLIDESSSHNSKQTTIEYKYEYSRARIYMILSEIGALSQPYEDPSLWSRHMNLPGSGISLSSDLAGQYYKYLEQNLSQEDLVRPQQLNKESSTTNPMEITSLESFGDPTTEEGTLTFDDGYKSDPLQAIREDFGDIPVYCIDEEDAYEVDDGVSIHEDNNKYVISVHVANPTALLKPESIISLIAFSKTSTTYTPDTAHMMLPKIISSFCELGVDGVPLNTFTVQYKLDKKLIDNCIEQYLNDPDSAAKDEESVLQTIRNQLDESIDIKFMKVRNFPQNFTYDNVNKLLNDETKLANFKENKSDDVNFDNLFKLYNISKLLGKSRGSIQFGRLRTNVKVVQKSEVTEAPSVDDSRQLSLGKSDKVIMLTNESGDEPKSTLLVTNLMIFANYSAAKFAHDNSIGYIYRGQDLNLPAKLTKELKELLESKGETSLEDVYKSRLVMVGAKLNTEAIRHEALAIDYYSHVTSPLRRFVDMVNHWKLGEYLLRKSGVSSDTLIDNKNLRFISNSLQNGDTMNRAFQFLSSRFWEGIFLKEIAELKQPFNFRLLIQGNPKIADSILVIAEDFSHLRCTLNVSPRLIEEFDNGTIKVGSVLSSDEIKLSKVDFIEDEVVFEYE